MEERVAVLETHYEHIRTDISDIKTDVRHLDGKIDALDRQLGAKIDGVKDSVTAISLQVAQFKVWAVMLYVTGLGALLLVMARGFEWL